jgi:nucleotide-binding universal stress UspA family protein
VRKFPHFKSFFDPNTTIIVLDRRDEMARPLLSYFWRRFFLLLYMKILVAYDGSQCSESALDDLSRAGLPPKGEAILITVAEVWLPPPDNSNGADAEADPYLEAAVKRFREKGDRLLNEASMLADHAAARLKNVLRGWKVTTCVTYGSPAWEIITKAEEFKPDLIVVGSNGQSALSRLVLGSISHKVLSESAFSVRISRGRNEVEPASERVIIGFDGSIGANAAVTAVAERSWSPGAEAQIISATDPVVPPSIGRFISPVANWAEGESKSDHKWIEDLAKKAVKVLERSGLSAQQRIIEGNPKEALVREAEKWHADCVFVGATAHNTRLGRLLLGSTASALAVRAHCSVEVVRT